MSSDEPRVRDMAAKGQSGKSDADETAEDKPAKASFLKKIWLRLGLDMKTLAMMFKGSVAPVVAIAMFQSDTIANHYGTLGYLIAIMSVIGLPIMPRGKFIETMSLNVLATGLGAAINLLALYCVTQARLHTTAPGTSPLAYNSSASAVCAVWLTFLVYIISCVRAARPQFQFPAIVVSIFTFVSLTYGVAFPNMAYAINFIEQLLEGFLTGFALATAVHFLILPVTSRTVVSAELTGYMMSITGILKAQTALMHALETVDPIAVKKEQQQQEAAKHEGHHSHHSRHAGDDVDYGIWKIPEAEAMKSALSGTIDLQAKINGDIVSAHREFAFGKLDYKDFSKIWKNTRTVLTPVLGLITILDLIRRITKDRQWHDDTLPEAELQRNRTALEMLHSTMKTLHEPFDIMSDLVDKGYKHVLYTLEFSKPPKSKETDEESRGRMDIPGTTSFAAYYKEKLHQFEQSKTVTMLEWCKEKGIDNPDAYFSSIDLDTHKENWTDMSAAPPALLRKQLFLMLYMEYLLLRVGHSVMDLIMFAEELKHSGKLSKSRLLFPGRKVLYKWIKSIFGSSEDMSQDDHFMNDMDTGGSEALYLGQNFNRRRSPEHLPPETTWEKIGDAIRVIPQALRSDASAFGLRVSAASMSIAIICYLEASQTFFLQQRLLWSLIMVSISMTRGAGQSTLNFVLRVAGTAIAMVGAYIVYYIVDGKTPGVIVFLWLWIFCSYYIVFKVQKLIIVGILSVVTVILIVGYELQVAKLGAAASAANGQPAYPTYILAPYRLATVAGGLLVAYIWTIFPYPISEHSELRKDLGAATYLLANLYSNTSEKVKSRIRGTYGDIERKGTHAYNLEKARGKIFVKLVALLAQLQANASFSKFQLRIGGKFPAAEYSGMIDCVRRILVCTSLISHAAETISAHGPDSKEQSQWSSDFRRVALSIGQVSHQVTSILSLSSASLSNAQPLPPFLKLPDSFELVSKMDAIDADILSVRHVSEPEYSAFVVMQLCSELLNANLAQLVGHVKSLIGEMDFSFHALQKEAIDSDETLNEHDRTTAKIA